MIVLQYLLGFIAFVFILGLIVLVHEAGHFIFARRAGILCYEFAIGMGPVIWQKKKGETVYSIRAIPIGGFVSMSGEEVEANPLRGKTEIKLVLENDRVTHLVTDLTHPDYQHLPTLTIVSYDIVGTKEALENELYIVVKNELGEEVKYTVNRDCIAVMGKKQIAQIAPYNRTFTHKSIGQRFMAIFAGPMMNFLLAILLFFLIGFFVGYPNMKSTMIEQVEDKTPAYEAGLRDGDQIITINGHPVSKWDDISAELAKLAKGMGFTGPVKVDYKRDGVNMETTVHPYVIIHMIGITLKPDGSNSTVIETFTPMGKRTLKEDELLLKGDQITRIKSEKGEYVTINNRSDLLSYFNNTAPEGGDYKIEVLRDGELKEFTIFGHSKEVLESQGYTATKVQLMISPEYRFDIVQLLYRPFVDTGDACLLIFRTLGQLFKRNSTVGLSDLSGPVGIFVATSSIAQGGIIPLLNWTAILSVNIGFLNILPLPALDGGRLAFLGYEAVTKKKPNTKVENIIHLIGFFLFMALFVFVTFNDVLRNCIGM
ncbi:MAG TPA: RIP metalloprotease RseP [Bacilli bacterium]|jgi:regulator of sigma E protease|nr:MAG: putative zinc metalloprotease [Tenericutes bacterium ADurb.Bin140]HON64496.1 RIP metalloprotease RseP [Bacilli bacterium]HPD12621.1 RIP metalloprotease RseP [Bacilli bacterium]